MANDLIKWPVGDWMHYMAKKASRSITSEHKAAMATGRSESAVVKRYLDALESNRPKRGRKRTAESVQRQLSAVDEKLASADPLQRLNLLQERLDLTEEMATMSRKVDTGALEDDFVEVARSYGERKGISYAAWREVGVAADVLKKAGISRARG